MKLPHQQKPESDSAAATGVDSLLSSSLNDGTIITTPDSQATLIQSDADTLAEEGVGGRTAAVPTPQSLGRDERTGTKHARDRTMPPAGAAEFQISGLNSQLQPDSAAVTADPSATLISGPQAVQDLEDLLETLVEGQERTSESGGGAAGLVIGDYQVLSELGRGGMGVVYKARHRKLNRIVALKMILHGKHTGGESLRRFLAEARAVAQMQRGIPGYRARIRPIVSRITIHWPSFYNVVTGKTLALPNLIALQHIPLSPAGVIAKRPAPIALPNSCAAEWRMAPDAVFSPYASVRYFTPHMVHSQYNLL
jgi:hypothetical protein